MTSLHRIKQRHDAPPFLTPWFPPDVRPVRDGVYLVRERRAFGPSDCWHAFRWDCKGRAWYSADSTGRQSMDLIGADRLNSKDFEWRGLAGSAPSGARGE